MAAFQDTFGNFMYLGVFILAAMGLIISVQSTNEAPQQLIDDPIFNDSHARLDSGLSSLEGLSETQYNQFTSEAPKPGFISIVLFSIVGMGKAFGNIIILVFTILVQLPVLVLGIPSTVYSVLISWVTIGLIIGAWVLYKIGG